jgi:two-component system chemotaxis sensor kinase CheA
MLPEMDGCELLDRIKTDDTLRNIPVIVVSSLEQREHQERGLALGADAYIVKRKFDHQDLLATIRQIL